MPDFGELFDKAKELADEHPDQVHSGVEKAEEFVQGRFGGQFGDQIEQGGNAVENFLGVSDNGEQQQQQQ
jgi:hypothetical protein